MTEIVDVLSFTVLFRSCWDPSSKNWLIRMSENSVAVFLKRSCNFEVIFTDVQKVLFIFWEAKKKALPKKKKIIFKGLFYFKGFFTS